MLKSRQLLLGVALLVTLGASFFDWPSEDISPVKMPATSQSKEIPAGRVPAVAKAGEPADSDKPEALPQSLRFAQATADLFASQSWLPPPPPPAKPQAPQAPALPFRYLGKVLEGGDVLVFVGEGARTHLLRKGDALPGYEVADVTATDISFVYLPLRETQRLTFGSAN